MAYAKINQLLEENTDQQQKTNIFAPQGPQQGAVAGEGTENVQKTGDQSPITSQSGAQVSGEGKPQADMTAGKNIATFQRNVGKQQTPKAFDKMGADISAAEQQLQSQADQYKTAQTQRGASIAGPEVGAVDKAIGGDQAFKSQVQGFLGALAPRADKFVSNVNTEVIPNLRATMKTGDSGPGDPSKEVQGDPSEAVKGYLRQQSGPQYTQSEADLDYQLLQGDPNFRTRLTELDQRQEALKQRAARLGGDLETEANTSLSAAQRAAQDKLRTDLQGRASGYLGKLDTEAKAEREKLAADRVAIEAAKERARLGVGADKSQARFMDQALNEDYYKTAVDALADPSNFIDEAGLNSYRTIYELLKSGQPDGVPLAVPERELAINTSGRGLGRGLTPEQVLERLQGTINQRETEFNTGLDRQIGDVRGRISSEDEAREAAYAKRVHDELFGEFGANAGTARELFQGVPFDVNLTEYDLATADERNQLASLYGDREIDMPTELRENSQTAADIKRYKDAIRAKILDSMRSGGKGDYYYDTATGSVKQSVPAPDLDKVLAQIEAEKARNAPKAPAPYVPPMAGMINIGGGMPTPPPGGYPYTPVARDLDAPRPTLGPNIAEILRADAGSINLGLPPPAPAPAPVVSLPPIIERPALPVSTPPPPPRIEVPSFKKNQDFVTDSEKRTGKKPPSRRFR
jgi:hypothetical protein